MTIHSSPLPRSAQRAARCRATVARAGRQPRRWERIYALVAELRHALGAKAAVVHGHRASFMDAGLVLGGLELAFDVGEGAVFLRMSSARARAALGEADPARVFFGMVGEVMQRAAAHEARAS